MGWSSRARGITAAFVVCGLAVVQSAAQNATKNSAKTRTVSDAEVMRVHRGAFLLDSHNDVVTETKSDDVLPTRPIAGDATSHTDPTRLKAGGVGAVFFSAWVDAPFVDGNRSAHRGFQLVDTIRHGIVDAHPEAFEWATSVKGIEDARRKGKIAALIGLEGGHAIEDDLGLLRDYYRLGVRYMTLTWSNTNNWADSSGDMTKEGVKHHNGLTPFGKDVVREMNRLGMMVDISHVADKTFWDALETSRAPVFASHSSSRAVANDPRNMTDEMIVALAKKGGVVQVNFNCRFVSERYRAASAEARKTMHVSIAELAEHFVHIKQIAGVDAIGIGSDYDGVPCVPDGMEDVSKFPNLTRALLERGFTEAEIRKIYGENTLRVMRAVEAAAGK